MNILLLSMPDSFEHTAPLTMRMPNGALGSLAGNVDPHHSVRIADLVLVQRRVPRGHASLVATQRPDVVGLSIMTFQRHTAQESGRRCSAPSARRRESWSAATTPSLATDVYEHPSWDVDCDRPRRRRHHVPRAACGRGTQGAIAESRQRALLSDRDGVHQDSRIGRPAGSSGDEVQLPNRSARALDGYTFLGRQIDVVETSRGCTFDCSFCSIIEMRGRNFYKWTIERVIADIVDARRRGARAIFLVDDNITLDVRRFEALCRAIVDAGLQRHRLHRAGDDLVDCRRWRHARAADAQGRVPLRLPRHRERARRGPRIPQGPGEKCATRPAPATPRRRRSTSPPPRHVRGRRPDRRQPVRHSRSHRSQSRVRAPAHRLALHPAPDALSAARR